MKPFSYFKKFFIILTFLMTSVAVFGVLHTFSIERDLTQNHRNSLTPASRALLKKLTEPLVMTMYGGDAETEKGAKDLVRRIQRINVPTSISFKTLEELPESIKKQYHGTHALVSMETANGLQWISLQNLYLTEDLLIQALREKNNEKPFLVFLEGHNERSIFDTNRDGLSEFKKHLDEMGVRSVSFNLAKGDLPENASAVAIVSPKAAYQPEELQRLQIGLQKGIRLIWLKDPSDAEAFQNLQMDLGFQFQPGTLIDGDGVSFESPHPAIIFIRHYPEEPLFQDMKEMSALPWVQSLQLVDMQSSWQKKSCNRGQ